MSTARVDRLLKLPVYARAGVGWCWFLDPLAETVEVFHLSDAAPRLVATAHQQVDARLPPFDAVPIDVSAWWASAARPG